MAKFTSGTTGVLADKIRAKASNADKAASLALNKTSTYTVNRSIEKIANDVNLDQSYIKKHISTVARASPVNLRTVIHSTDKATLLNRYTHSAMKKGVRVAVNKKGGSRYIRNAFMVSGLRGSNTTGIALRNRDAAEYFKLAMGKGQRTGKKSRKLQRLISKAREKPNGIEVLHSRSINQLFTSVRTDIADDIQNFLLTEFLTQFNRLKK